MNFYPEWIQAQKDNKYTDNRYNNSRLDSYSLYADLLPTKPFTVHLLGKKYQNSFRNTFSQRAIIDTDTYGGRLGLKYKDLPTTLGYTNKKIDRKGVLLSSLDQDLFDFSMIHQQKKSVTRLSTNYRDSLQTNEGERNSLKTSDNLLRNTYSFNSDSSKKLSKESILGR